MIIRLLLLFAIVPLIELAVLIQIGRHIGVLETIAVLIAAGLIGAAVVRRAGARASQKVQADLAAGRVPADSLLDGLIVLIAGVMLIIPGVISDALAVLVLLPPVRRLIRAILKSRFRSRLIVLQGNAPGAAREWVDVEPRSAHDVDSDRPQLP